MGKCPKVFFILLLSVAVTSCIPYKKQVYWQFMEDVSADSSVFLIPPKGTYGLQVDDIIDIQINSENQDVSWLFSKTYSIQQPNNQAQQAASSGSGGDPFYLTGYIVDDSGFVKLPKIGKLKVLELTVEEVERLIEAELLNYFVSGSFYVSVKLGGLRFSILGEVKSQGRYVVLERNYNIFQALAQFNDVGVFAQRNDVYIMRKQDGGYKISKIDLLDEDVFNSEFFYIMPNDVIYVRPSRVKPLGFSATFLQNFNTTLTFLSSSLLIWASIRTLN